MQGKQTAPRRIETPADVQAAAKSLADSVESLRKRNEAMRAYLEGENDDPVSRVANAPLLGLDDATERARKYWDKLEGRRSSTPPKGPKK